MLRVGESSYFGGHKRIGGSLTIGAASGGAGTLRIPVDPKLSTAYGLLSLGSGPFDGVAADRFVGSTWGTVLAINTGPASASDFINCLYDGAPRFKVDWDGVLTTANNIISGGDVRIAVNGAIKVVGTVAGIYWDTAQQPFCADTSGFSTFHFGHFGGPRIPTAKSLSWYDAGGANVDVVLVRDAAGVLALRNGANPQALRVYGTFTDASNYERAKLGWNASVLEIGAEALGTGTLRNVKLIGGVVYTGAGGSTTTPALGIGSATTGWSAVGSAIYSVHGGAGGIAFSSSFFGMVSGVEVCWSPDASDPTNGADIRLAREAAQTLALRNVANPMELRIYGTRTNATNYERLTLKAVTGAAFQIVSEALGSGTVRSIKLDPGTADIQWGKALVALGGGAAPTLGTIGGAGPAAAAQNTWLRLLDSTGAACWVPVWK